MHVDDRLATVLRMPVNGQAMARIQYRQLIDLVGREAEIDPFALDAALERLRMLKESISADDRAAMLGESSMRLVNPALVAWLVTAEPAVATAAMAAADLNDAQWLALIPQLPVRARGILRHRRDLSPRVEALLERLGIGDRALPPAALAQERSSRPALVVLDGGAAATRRANSESGEAGIGAIVRRIADFRKSREASASGDGTADAGEESAAHPAPRRPSVLALDFTTEASGRVDWAEGASASGLVGTRLAETLEHADAASWRQALRHRQPIQAATVTLSGAPDLAGTWRLDALPRFGQVDGRFIGYAGRLRRATMDKAQPAASAHADTMRQVLHELRTPANAIQIAAEIIQQQLYGPAPHEYRALAAAIAGDTAQILAGFDELDRLVKLESGALSLHAGRCDLGTVVAETVERLHGWVNARGSSFAFKVQATPLPIALDKGEATRLVWRLLAALAGALAPGEALGLELAQSHDAGVLTIDVAPALAERLGQSDRTLPSEAARSLSAGMFGIGFTLRLAQAEARAAHGALRQEGCRFELVLPGLTGEDGVHTHA